MTGDSACPQLEQVHALADGELTGADADAIRDHLAGCAACQAELAEVMQLDAAVVERAAAVDHAPAPVVSLAWYRRRKLQVAAAGAFAVAAGVAIFLAVPRGRTGPEAVAVALAPHRVIEARLAWPGAAAHRTYDVPRAGDAPHETIPLTALAELDQRGDVHGVGVLDLLNGESAEAARNLARAGDSADVLADRAALALAQHQPERARTFAGAALAKQARHPAALWNLALALRDLGRLREAAGAFRAVAALGEPGWAAEATERAAALDRQR